MGWLMGFLVLGKFFNFYCHVEFRCLHFFFLFVLGLSLCTKAMNSLGVQKTCSFLNFFRHAVLVVG